MLRFRAGVYAFTAHRVTDPGHSNWSGKSFLLEIIRFAISHYRGQMSEVARRLKIGRSTLYRKLDEAAEKEPGNADETS